MFKSRRSLKKWTCLAVLANALLAAPSAGANPDPPADPTRPPTMTLTDDESEPDRDVDLDLSAVFFSDGRRVAIINGERVRESEKVGTARVLRIHPDRVDLSRQGETIELRLIGDTVKESRE